jgi:hypothetical protein
MRLQFILLSSLTALVAGCATPPPQAPVTPPPQIDPVLLSIAESAKIMAQSTYEMKQIQSAVNAPNISPAQKAQIEAQQLMVPPGLGHVVSIPQYDGIFTTLVQAIAESSGWSYSVEGQRPPVIQVIHKSYVNVRAVDALRDIGHTIHGAQLVLDPVNRKIIVRF